MYARQAQCKWQIISGGREEGLVKASCGEEARRQRGKGECSWSRGYALTMCKISQEWRKGTAVRPVPLDSWRNIKQVKPAKVKPGQDMTSTVSQNRGFDPEGGHSRWLNGGTTWPELCFRKGPLAAEQGQGCCIQAAGIWEVSVREESSLGNSEDSRALNSNSNTEQTWDLAGAEFYSRHVEFKRSNRPLVMEDSRSAECTA